MMHQNPDLKEHQARITHLYLSENLSVNTIAEKLRNQGVDVSNGYLNKKFSIWGIRRTASQRAVIATEKQRNSLKIKICDACENEFQPTANIQKVCKICIPHKKAFGLFQKFKISWLQYERLRMKQNDKCSICDVSFSTLQERQIVVDHCHKTGEIRGILCNRCNVGMGYIDIENWSQRANLYKKHFENTIPNGVSLF